MMLPARTHAIVLVSKIHKPTMRAVAYARAMRPTTLEAVTVNVDPEETRALQAEWDRRGIPVPLKVLDSPFREVTDPVIDYVRGLRSGSPRDLVTVLIPEYVVGHWWEHLLHNQSALRLKGRLLFTPGRHGDQRAVAAGQLGRARGPAEGLAPGAVRRGDRPTGTGAVRLSDAPESGCRRAGPAVGTDLRGRASGRSRTAVTASRATRAGSSSSGTPCPASGCGSSSPTGTATVVVLARRRGRGARRLAGPGRRRRARGPARGAAAAATCSTRRRPPSGG